MEGGCKVFDQLAEVHTLVSNIVENSLVAVALIFHITNLHLQTEPQGYLTTLNHRGMLTALGLMILLHIHRTGNAVDTLDIVGTLEVSLLELQLHQSARQCNHTDVVSWVGFYSHDIAFLQFEVVHIMIIALTGMLELNLNQIGGIDITWNISQPVVGVQLFVLSPHCLMTESAVATNHCFEVFHFFHMLVDYISCYLLINSTIICSAKSKKTILPLAF